VVTEEQNGYTTHAGLVALRECVAQLYPELAPTPDQVIIPAGSQEALYLALLTLVETGDEVLLPDPGFVAYPTIVRMAGGAPFFYRLPSGRNFAFDIDDFRRRLSPRTRVVVCISPSNPTGRALTSGELAAMAEALRETNAYVVSDEIYRDVYYTDERPPSISEFYPRTIVVSGLSKSMSMTGWRLGWLCGGAKDDELAAAVRSALVLHGYVTTCASSVSQKAALAAWTPEAEDARRGIRQIFRERRDFLAGLIEKELSRRAVLPDGAFYMMVETGREKTSLEIAEALLTHGVITVPGGAFGDESEGFLRVSFCADREALAEGVRRMANVL
jgi:aspartate aminotransferase